MRYQAEIEIFKKNGILLPDRETALRAYESIAFAQQRPGNRLLTITSTTTTATATSEKPHGLASGDTVIILGAELANHNKSGGVSVTVTTPFAFTYAVTSTNGTSTFGRLYELQIEYDVPSAAIQVLSTLGTLTTFNSNFDLGQTHIMTDRATRNSIWLNIKRIKAGLKVNETAVAVTSITCSSTTATVTTTTNHGYVTGDYVIIDGCAETDYNVTAQITVTSPTAFTYTVANSPSTPATTSTEITAVLTYSRIYYSRNSGVPVQMDLQETYDTLKTDVDTEEALSLPDGDATTPGMAWDSDANTGFYRSASGIVGFSSNGTQTVGFDSSGLLADIIGELTASAGVTVDGVLLKDGTVVKGTATVAATGTNQATAAQIASDYNNITGATGSSGTGVKLPATSTGRHVVVSNTDNSNALLVYPGTGGKINRGSANASITVAANTTVVFVGDLEATTDYSMSVLGATQYVNSVGELTSGSGITFLNHRLLLVQTGITAHAGGGQGSAVALTGDLCYITTCATAGNSVILPAAVAGMKVEVHNGGAANANVFPATGEAIAGGSANAAYAVGVGSTQVFSCNTAGAWQVSIAGELLITDTRLTTPLGTAGAATVSVKEFGDGYNMVTELTLTSFVVGALAGAAAALGIGNKAYTFPAGAFVLGSTYITGGLTATGTTHTPVVGIGSVIATGAVSVLSGTATFQDYVTGQTAPDIAGGSFTALVNPTAGVQTGIGLNVAASVKDIFLNAAATWSANNTGNLVFSGTIRIMWTKMA